MLIKIVRAALAALALGLLAQPFGYAQAPAPQVAHRWWPWWTK